jgi:hypothetical protein
MARLYPPASGANPWVRAQAPTDRQLADEVLDRGIENALRLLAQ